MLITALIIFAIVASVGLFMATRIFRSRPVPVVLSVLHAMAAASAMTLVVWQIVVAGWPTLLMISGGCFLLAALEGLYLGSFRDSRFQPPRPAVVAHASLAVLGVLLLIVHIGYRMAPGIV